MIFADPAASKLACDSSQTMRLTICKSADFRTDLPSGNRAFINPSPPTPDSDFWRLIRLGGMKSEIPCSAARFSIGAFDRVGRTVPRHFRPPKANRCLKVCRVLFTGHEKVKMRHRTRFAVLKFQPPDTRPSVPFEPFSQTLQMVFWILGPIEMIGERDVDRRKRPVDPGELLCEIVSRLVREALEDALFSDVLFFALRSARRLFDFDERWKDPHTVPRLESVGRVHDGAKCRDMSLRLKSDAGGRVRARTSRAPVPFRTRADFRPTS